jgi:hypothetical protein
MKVLITLAFLLDKGCEVNMDISGKTTKIEQGRRDLSGPIIRLRSASNSGMIRGKIG